MDTSTVFLELLNVIILELCANRKIKYIYMKYSAQNMIMSKTITSHCILNGYIFQ